jgi:acyl-CoA synthetase (AMP-forming)/AMP-acid ligase II
MSHIDANALAALLARHPDVDDAVVLRRAAIGGAEELVGYLVTSRGATGDRIADEVGRDAGVAAAVTGVPVAAIPLDAEGQPDTAALEAVPVVDESSIRAWDVRVRAALGAVPAGIVPVEWAPPATPIHLSEVAPASWGAAGEAESGAPGAAPAGRADAAGGRTTGAAAAVSHGDELVRAGAPLTMLDTLRRAAERSADRSLRFVRPDLSVESETYPELLADAERVLGGLRRLGLTPGDRVLLQLPEHRDFLGALWGCMLGGFIPVPVAIAPTYREPNAVTQKLAAAWRMLGRPLVLASHELVAELESLGRSLALEGFRVASMSAVRASERDTRWHGARPEDVALIMLTSGSTGTPKGVKLTHANLVARALGSAQMKGFDRDEVTLNWMPLDHVAGILILHLPDVHLGCDQIHVPTDVILGDPLRWMDLIERYRVTITFAPNFAYGLVNDRAAQIRERSWDLSSLECFINGGEAIVARTARRFLELLIPHGLSPSAMWPAWGMSETCSEVTCSDRFSLERVRDTDSFVEVGRPVPGFSLRVVDDAGRVVSEGATGHLEVTGANLMAGYYDSSLDAEAFTPDGWFKTGDLAVIRDGRMTITGRAKDVIIINGVNYYSHELESVVEEVPAVATSFVAACAVRAPGDDTDRLAIIFNAEVDDDAGLLRVLREIRQRCMRDVGVNPDYLIPVGKGDIPKTEIGKIQRPRLAQRFAEGGFDEQKKRVDMLLGSERQVPDWFFRRIWVRSERRAATPGERGSWVVFVDEGGLGDAVCEELRRRGESALAVEAGDRCARLAPDRWVIDPSDPAHYERLVVEALAGRAPVARTLHLWTFGDAGVAAATPEGIDWALERGLLSALAWIQALARSAARARSVELLAVSSGAQSTCSGDRVDAARAALLGLLRSAPQELAWLRCRHLDVPPGDPAATAATIVGEALQGAPERELAYRGGKRLAARLVSARPTVPPAPRAPIRRGGVYLLTGGLGGIGREVARHLLERFDARLLVVGRSDPQPGAIEQLAAHGGAVRHARVDAADLDALRRAVADAERAWGRALDGVFHLAAVYHERALLEETAASFRELLHPKLVGTQTLERLLADRPDAFLVGFSSVVSAFGGALVGAYATANAALEAMVADAAARGGAARVCVSWSTWEDVGMSRAFSGGALLRAKGYLPVSAPLGIASLLSALSRAEPLLYVGLDGANLNVRRQLAGPDVGRLGVDVFFAGSEADGRAALGEVELADRFGTRVTPRVEWRAQLPLAADGSVDMATLADGRRRSAADPLIESPASELEQAIARVWKATLKRDRIDVRDNFFDLGGNSLLLAQASAALSYELRRPVPLTDMFQFSTVRTLALHLGGGRPSPSEELAETISQGAQRAERLRARRNR